MPVDLTLRTDLLCTAILVPLQIGEGQRHLLDLLAWQGEVMRVLSPIIPPQCAIQAIERCPLTELEIP